MNIRSFITLIIIFLTSCSPVSTLDVTVTPTLLSRATFPMISDVGRYKEIMDAFKHHPLVAHFPEFIPANANQVQFAYQPRIMQGAMFVELLMTLPATDIQDIANECDKSTKYMVDTNEFSEDLPEPILYLLRDKNHEINDEFTLCIIDMQPAGSGDMPWNHGHSSGIGVNKTDLQVIYWAEYW